MRRRLISASIAALLVLAAIPATDAVPAGLVRFRFAFGALTGAGAKPTLTAITQDTTLKTGDRIKMLVEMQQPGFVYVIHHGPKDEVNLLFPPDLNQSIPIGRTHYIPAGAIWLTLDDATGNETFYVLGSVERLGGLEALLARYNAPPPSGKAAIATSIVAEIRRLRTQHRNVTAPAERPVIIGGNVRSLDQVTGRELPDVGTIAVDVTAGDFYARTFTVTHQ